jgi:hypothetical protein
LADTREEEKREKNLAECGYSDSIAVFVRRGKRNSEHLPVAGALNLWAFHNDMQRCLKNVVMKNNIHVNNLFVSCIAFHAVYGKTSESNVKLIE